MSKKLHPAIKLTNAIIRWFNKPKTYVREGQHYYETQDGTYLPAYADNDNPGQICRTCLIGAVNLQARSLDLVNFKDILLNEVDKIIDINNGYTKNRNYKQAQNVFIKVKNKLELKIKRGELL